MADATHDINEIKRRMQGAVVALKGNSPDCARAALPRTCSIR